MQTVGTFLMFRGQAEEAMRFYVSLFDDATIELVSRWGEGQPGKPGTVYQAAFTLRGQRFLCFDSPVEHAFGFTPATSIHVACDTADEVDALFAKLSDGGSVLMPLGAYPFSARYAWLNDRYGVSWQLALRA